MSLTMIRTLIFGLAIALSAVTATGQPTAPWTPPIGIPVPAFGITQTHMMYVGQQYAYYSTGNGPYKDAGNGPYTHYVDSSSPACSNASTNNYGTAAVPRCNMPNAFFVAPGAVIEVHAVSSTPSQISMVFVGTEAAPIFVRGANATTKGVISNVNFLIRGQYVIHEHLTFTPSGPDIRSVAESVHHIVVRKSHAHTGAGISVVGVNATYRVSHVVVYDNQIYTDNFNPNGGEFPELDRVGVFVGGNTEDVWVVDNDIRGQSGDAVGAGHAANYTAKRWYIGRNLLHDTGENGIDLKEVEDVVVSQNKIYNFTGLSTGSDGTAVVIHYGPKLSPKNTWVIFNEIYNATDIGIQVGGDQIPESYFIGNVIRDIRNAAGTARAFMTWNSCKINLIGNTFVNNDNGIAASGTGACGKLVLKNNIIEARGFSINPLNDTGYTAASEISHNLVSPAPSLGVTCLNCVTAVPEFVDAVKGDYRLRAGSPGIDAADPKVMDDVAALFLAAFKLSITTDLKGRPRPIGLGYDIGAFEADAPAPPPPPPPVDPPPPPPPSAPVAFIRHALVVVNATATALPASLLTAETKACSFQVETTSARWRGDGGTLTTTSGVPLPVGTARMVEGLDALKAVRVVRATGTNTKLHVWCW